MITIKFIATGADGASSTTTIQAKPGHNLMQAAVSANVGGIAADCGGLLSCGTCHVMVREPHASALPPPDAEELSLLDFTATPRQPGSRLSCQIVLTAAMDGLTLDLPAKQH